MGGAPMKKRLLFTLTGAHLALTSHQRIDRGPNSQHSTTIECLQDQQAPAPADHEASSIAK